MSSKPHEVFTRDEIKGFVSEFMKALGRAHTKIAAIDSDDIGATTDNRERRASIDKAILRGELAREKRQRVTAVASDPMATNKDLVAALGGESAVTPLQLARLVKADQIPAEVTPAEAPPDFMRRVLGSGPSTRELSRYAEVVEAARGRLSSSSSGEILVDGEALGGTNLVAVLQYLTKGSRGRSKPTGADVVGQILREGGIRTSGFTPTVIPLLGVKAVVRRRLDRGRPPYPAPASCHAYLSPPSPIRTPVMTDTKTP